VILISPGDLHPIKPLDLLRDIRVARARTPAIISSARNALSFARRRAQLPRRLRLQATML
jgi:hypothetical protein